MTTPRRRLETPHRRRRIIAGAAAGVLVLAAVLAFTLGGSDDDPDNAANSDGSSTTSPGGSTDGTTGTDGAGGPNATGTNGANGDEVDPADDAIITPTELEPFLLRGSDLPPGWRTLAAASQATDELMGTCMQKAIVPSVPHVLTSTSFRSGSNGPVLTATVRDYTTPQQSARAMTAISKAVLNCVNTTGKPTLTPLTVPSKADASTGVTFTVTQEGSSARGEVLIARVGARSATLALIGLTEKDLELGRDALRTMIARLD